jgi:hypothetical protein
MFNVSCARSLSSLQASSSTEFLLNAGLGMRHLEFFLASNAVPIWEISVQREKYVLGLGVHGVMQTLDGLAS